MQNQPKTIEAKGLVMTYSPGFGNSGMNDECTPSNLAEAAVRVLGACLLLYRQYAPDSSATKCSTPF